MPLGNGFGRTHFCLFAISTAKPSVVATAEGIVPIAEKKGKWGNLIGFVGSSGQSINPHLHYSIKKDGTWTGPMAFIGE